MSDGQPAITSVSLTAQCDASRACIQSATNSLDIGKYAWKVLVALQVTKGVAVENASLSSSTGLIAPRVSEAMTELLAKGFVRTRTASKDRRKLLVQATAKGLEAYQFVKRTTCNVKAQQSDSLGQILSDSILAQSSIGLSGFRIMLLLSEVQTANVSGCSRNLHIPQATVSKTFARLKHQELVELCGEQPKDRRSSYYQLNDNGKELLAALLNSINTSRL